MSPSYGFGRNFSFSHSVIARAREGFYGAAVIPGETSIWPLPPRRASCDPGCMPPSRHCLQALCGVSQDPPAPRLSTLMVHSVPVVWREAPEVSVEEGRRQLRRPGGGATVCTPVTGRYYLPPVVVRTPPVHHHRCSSRMLLPAAAGTV